MIWLFRTSVQQQTTITLRSLKLDSTNPHTTRHPPSIKKNNKKTGTIAKVKVPSGITRGLAASATPSPFGDIHSQCETPSPLQGHNSTERWLGKGKIFVPVHFAPWVAARSLPGSPWSPYLTPLRGALFPWLDHWGPVGVLIYSSPAKGLARR